MPALSKEEALNIRDGDIVLVAMRVERTNSHHDTRIGVKLTCRSPCLDNRTMVEKEKGPQPPLEIYTGISVHSVAKQELRVKDWVAWDVRSPSEQGKIAFIDGDEATIRLRVPVDGKRNSVRKLAWLHRISCPDDLTEAEKKAMTDGR